jgi:hypothetical protein
VPEVPESPAALMPEQDTALVVDHCIATCWPDTIVLFPAENPPPSMLEVRVMIGRGSAFVVTLTPSFPGAPLPVQLTLKSVKVEGVGLVITIPVALLGAPPV